MDKKELTKELLAGVFFFLGIFLLVAVIIVLGGSKGLAQSKFQVTVLYRNVGGLMEGAPVRLAGVNVGTVDRVAFLDHEFDGRRVEVRLNIFSQYRKQLENNLRFTVQTEGILGEKLIAIDVLREGPPVDLKNPIIGEDPMDVEDMAEVFARAAESFTKTADQLSQIDVVALSKVMEESSESISTTSRKISEVMEELQEITKKTRRLLDRVEQKVIEGNLFKVF